MANIDDIAYAIGADKKNPTGIKDWFGRVVSMSPFKVARLGSEIGVECVNLAAASVGDMVYVLKRPDGQHVSIGTVGGGALPSVLYDNPSGSNDTITLEDSAANYDYMRIYFRKSGDSDAHNAVDIHEPDGKRASLFLSNAYSSSAIQFVGQTVTISGNTITPYNMGGYYNVNGGGAGTSSKPLYITRVEAWSGGASIGFGGGSGGGGGGGGGSQIDLLWTNPNPTSNFAAQTLSDIPWQNYKFLLIDHYTAGNGNVAAHYQTSVISTDNPSDWSWITCIREVPFGRGVKFPARNQVQFGSQTYYSTYNDSNATMYDDWQFIVPTKIWGVKQGGSSGTATDVLYADDSGTTGTVTLSKSAANYDHMRIYFRYIDDDFYGSVDVYSPNGKTVQLSVSETTSWNGWLIGRAVVISGTSITTHNGNNYGEGKVNGDAEWNNVNKIAITRVEAWNGTYTSATEATCTLDTTYASTGRSTVKCSKNGGVCTITFMPLVLKAQSGRNTFGTVPEGFRPVNNEFYIHPNGWVNENYLIVGTDGTLKANVNLPSENESWASGTYVIGG